MVQSMTTGQSDISDSRLDRRQRQQTSTPRSERATILIVDDETSIAEVLSEALGEAGYEVLIASNGRTGLMMSRLFQPALVLTDYMMPGLGGAELVRELRQNSATRDIPAVLMSCARPLANELGGVTFLAKPFDLDAVVEIVARELQAHKRMRRMKSNTD